MIPILIYIQTFCFTIFRENEFVYVLFVWRITFYFSSKNLRIYNIEFFKGLFSLFVFDFIKFKAIFKYTLCCWKLWNKCQRCQNTNINKTTCKIYSIFNIYLFLKNFHEVWGIIILFEFYPIYQIRGNHINTIKSSHSKSADLRFNPYNNCNKYRTPPRMAVANKLPDRKVMQIKSK